MHALHKDEAVEMQRACGLLCLHSTKHGINASGDATHGFCITATCILAGPIGVAVAVRTQRAHTHTKHSYQHCPDLNEECIHCCKRIRGQ